MIDIEESLFQSDRIKIRDSRSARSSYVPLFDILLKLLIFSVSFGRFEHRGPSRIKSHSVLL